MNKNKTKKYSKNKKIKIIKNKIMKNNLEYNK